jgi:DNA-binding response OmpR family regulator
MTSPEVPPKILVVEDDEPVASMLCFLLAEQGHECIEAGTAEAGWAEVHAHALSTAIVDLRLPGRDGWWLIRRIRREPRTHRLPILLITGFLDEKVAKRAAELGCESLGKPFSFTELADKLEGAADLAARLPEWTGQD